MSDRRSPNIVIYISHDTGRHIGPYGIKTVHTPNADQLANEGVLFANCFCTAPQCSPSRAGLFTGRYPHAVGVNGLTGAWAGWTLNKGEKHMARYLQEQGYETGLFGLVHETLGGDAPLERLDSLGFDFKQHSTFYPARKAGDDLGKWLDSRTDPCQPFFAQIGVFETHRPFDFDDNKPDTSLGLTIPPYLNDKPATRKDLATFQGMVQRWDEGLGKIMQALQARNLSEDTILIVTTDHGLAMPRAKTTLYDAGISVLLMIRYPGVAIANMRNEDLISNVDILPTLLEGIGAKIPNKLHGQSFWPALANEDYKTRKMIFAGKTYHAVYDPVRCVRTSKHKYIRHFEPIRPEQCPDEIFGSPLYFENLDRIRISRMPWVELYDIENDPLEIKNLAGHAACADIEKHLGHALYAWMRETDDPLLNGATASPDFHKNMANLAAL